MQARKYRFAEIPRRGTIFAGPIFQSRAFRKILIHSHHAEVDERTGTLRKCVRSEETCPQEAPEAYFRTLEEPLGQRFAGDDVFYQRFHKQRSCRPLEKGGETKGRHGLHAEGGGERAEGEPLSMGAADAASALWR